MSADPLTVHGLGADPNLYAYVSGQALKATDPLGLEVGCDAACLERTGQMPGEGIREFKQLWSQTEKLPWAAKWAARAALINYSPSFVVASIPASPAEPIAGVVFVPAKTGARAVAKMPALVSAARVAGQRLAQVFRNKSVMDEVAAGRAWVVGKHGAMGEYGKRKGVAESHHGVLSKWMKTQYGDEYRENQAPAVLIAAGDHDKTRAAFNTWQKEMKDKMGGEFRWEKVSAQEARDLANKLFDAAGTPTSVREEYFKQFDAYRQTLDAAKSKAATGK